jgi:hypothetical protein
MPNLLAETVQALTKAGKCPNDVEFVSTVDGSLTWDQFASAAKDVEYDSGYGINYISTFLKIVGDEWWLERYEYDGSECWEYKNKPKMPVRCVESCNYISAIMNPDAFESL